MTTMNHERQSSAGIFDLRLAVAVLAFITALNLLLPIFMPIPPMIPSAAGTLRINQTDSGYPREWELPLEQVALTVEDSINFQLDTVEGAEQWHAIQPSRNGYITLGEGSNKRRFRLAMFHALDCLDTIRQNVLQRKADRDTPASAEAHFCLDYLRQTIQCRSDIQLEQVRSEYGGKSVQPFITHSNCRDWSKVYAELDQFGENPNP